VLGQAVAVMAPSGGGIAIDVPFTSVDVESVSARDLGASAGPCGSACAVDVGTNEIPELFAGRFGQEVPGAGPVPAVQGMCALIERGRSF
jgi:hypothetical protein